MTGRRRLLLEFSGSVQGVGFRPTLYRLAVELGLDGSVSNTLQGARVELEGSQRALTSFFHRFPGECPPLARVTGFTCRDLPLRPEEGFRILESGREGAATAVALPDAAVCPACADEVLDPKARRFRYPFTNCTHCGPRFSILRSLPYDRERTTMASFAMCPDCRKEYEDPTDRRFHAQPIACPACGPQIAWWDAEGKEGSRGHAAMMDAAEALKRGAVVAVKGLGGFQLCCLATDDAAVRSLRERKKREEKPLAVMFPDRAALEEVCSVSPSEADLLTSPAAPIVLLSRRDTGTGLSSLVAPGNPNLGAFLPTTPLHLLLLREVGSPLVVTSGNFSDEPMVTDEREAVERLAGAADGFLVHDRPIARAVDDSVARVVAGRALVLRRARGYAPRPVLLPGLVSGPTVLAVGAHLKNTVTLLSGERAVVGQHIGDLETTRARAAFEVSAQDLPRLHGEDPFLIACDDHPDYASTRYAESLGKPLVRVQHHAAHLAACAAEHSVWAESLGVSWDGTGWGGDGTVWGGEFFVGKGGTWTRRGHLRPFRLPGGEAAVREPRRSALGLLHAWEGSRAFERMGSATIQAFRDDERRVLRQLLEKGTQSPWTSSVGRLFDGVSSLLGLHQRIAFEGQGAMGVEFIAEAGCADSYPIQWVEKGPLPTLDWSGILEGILGDTDKMADKPWISAKFQNALVEGIIKASVLFGQNRVLLSGGCFQNKFLLESCARRLEGAGLEVFWPREVPPNDGGISLGQAVVARVSMGSPG